MKKTDYFREMARVTEAVWPRIETAVERVFPAPSTYSSGRLLAVLELRRNRPLFKPFLVYLCSLRSDSPGAPSGTFSAGAAAELINIASYQCNSGLDQKYEVFSADEKDEQQLAGILSREAARSLAASAEIPGSAAAPHLLGEAYAAIARGQLLDLFDLTVERRAVFTSEEHYLSRYLLRCELLSGVFTRNCAVLGARLAKLPEQHEKQLAEFGLNLGIAMQIANDIGDLVVPARATTDHLAKPYQDALSDFRNGRLTLPVYLLLRNSHGEDRELVSRALASDSGEHPGTSEVEGIGSLFAQSRAWPECRRLAKSYALRAKAALKQLPDQPGTRFLSCMASIAKSNKYNYRLAEMRSAVPVRAR